ncbi:DUF1428 domain-containing protein [Mangrovicoccus algicola]|uniref:DUF1428 domain-containing protein n=1 Tax=Mangrovicoccus algicola TaxID=2771008 RepID=A0A8J7CKF5_9RHOB|nr:DUF1428 domain-containing protein [Mangrovicoccus algicola]MBE3638746.1 DUF1428 domain-containing protein [Mangrovicoccus algicola]
MTHVTGFLAAVADAKKEAYIDHARRAWPIFRDYGAIAMKECWGVNVPDGEVTSFPMAVKKEDGETVVFSWIEWPDQASAETCWASMESDPRWKEMPAEMPFDGKRMIFGGFDVIVEG